MMEGRHFDDDPDGSFVWTGDMCESVVHNIFEPVGRKSCWKRNKPRTFAYTYEKINH